MKRIKRDFQAFLDGYKPALIMDNDSRYFLRVKHFPRYCYNKYLTYFFQNDSLKEKFTTELKKVVRGSYEECCLIGLTLGYPKKSVEFFARNDQIEKEIGVLPNRDVAIGMAWAGFRFSTSLEFLEEEAKWMWETYQHPKANENPMYFWSDKENTYLSVPYGDVDRLREVRDSIMKERGSIVTNK